MWPFFWGVVTGAGIMFAGVLFGIVFYDVLKHGVIEKLEQDKEAQQ